MTIPTTSSEPTRSELSARLDHLRHAERRTLRGVQRHENRADQVADHQSHDGPSERQREHGHRQSAGDDRQQHQVRAEPHGEKIAGGAMPPIERDRLDGTDLELCCLFAVVHGTT